MVPLAITCEDKMVNTITNISYKTKSLYHLTFLLLLLPFIFIIQKILYFIYKCCIMIKLMLTYINKTDDSYDSSECKVCHYNCSLRTNVSF